MGQGNRDKPLRCWIAMHTWVTRVNAGARWQECGRCGKYSRKVVMNMNNRFPPAGMGDGGGCGAGG